MKIPVRNLYYLLAYAWGHADAAREREADEAPIDTLPDLLAFVLAKRVSALLKRGMDRSYAEERLVLAGVRGKLDLSTTVKRNLLAQARTACSVEEFRHDILQNQILRKTLKNLLALPRLDPEVRASVGLVYRKLEEISEIKIRRSSFRRVRIHRNNRPYRFLMNLCSLIHDSLHLDEAGAAHFADLRDRRNEMARLFESFVANFYAEEQAIYKVSNQSSMKWFGARSAVEEELALLPDMRPDVILVSHDRRVILDAKFYVEALKLGWHGGRRIHSGHLYQLFSYLENRNLHVPDGPVHEGMLLYPVVSQPFRHDYELKGHRIQVRSIDLDQDWRGIHDDLLRMIGCDLLETAQRSRPQARPA